MVVRKDQEKERDNNSKVKVVALVSPHAGYVFSGSCAAHGFYELYKNLNFEERCVVILGVNHTGLGGSGISLSDFETPLGVAKNNRFLSLELSKFSGVPIDESAHIYEHSIEVQIPFLQYIFNNRFSLIPIVVDSDTNFNKLAKALIEIKSMYRGDLIIVASSDFTHYGIDYHYTPFGENANERVKQDDLNTIKFILIKDSNEFLKRANERTICGRYTITALLEYLASLEEQDNKVKITGNLLKYYQSSEIYPSSSFVSYASIVFKLNLK